MFQVLPNYKNNIQTTPSAPAFDIQSCLHHFSLEDYPQQTTWLTSQTPMKGPSFLSLPRVLRRYSVTLWHVFVSFCQQLRYRYYKYTCPRKKHFIFRHAAHAIPFLQIFNGLLLRCAPECAGQVWTLNMRTPNLGIRRPYRGSGMVSFERALVSSYRLSIVTFPLSDVRTDG